MIPSEAKLAADLIKAAEDLADTKARFLDGLDRTKDQILIVRRVHDRDGYDLSPREIKIDVSNNHGILMAMANAVDAQLTEIRKELRTLGVRVEDWWPKEPPE